MSTTFLYEDIVLWVTGGVIVGFLFGYLLAIVLKNKKII